MILLNSNLNLWLVAIGRIIHEKIMPLKINALYWKRFSRIYLFCFWHHFLTPTIFEVRQWVSMRNDRNGSVILEIWHRFLTPLHFLCNGLLPCKRLFFSRIRKQNRGKRGWKNGKRHANTDKSFISNYWFVLKVSMPYYCVCLIRILWIRRL